MNSEVKVYSYPNGDIQKVQVVRWEDWSKLEFLRPSYSSEAIKCFGDIYENFLIPACPWLFGQLVMFQLPEDVEITDDCGFADTTSRYGAVTERLTKATLILKNGVYIKGGRPCFRTDVAKHLWKKLEERGCCRVIRGKLPMTQIIPVGNFAGLLSQEEGALKVNSSFFIMDPIDCASVYDQVGAILGLCVRDGNVISPPLFGREALLVGKDGKVGVKEIEIQELTIEINGKRYQHGKNATVYSRPEHIRVGKSMIKRYGKDGCAVVIVGNRVVAVKQDGGVDVPASGFVMCLEESASIVGAEVCYRGLEDIQFGIQVGNSAVRDGVKTKRFISRFYNIRKLQSVPFPPSLYPMDYENGRAARIVLGGAEDGKPMLLWFEGAAKFGYKKGEGSCGASLSEVAEIVANLGMVDGVHLDGGGSAQILLENKRVLQISDRKRDDYSEAERIVPLGLVIR